MLEPSTLRNLVRIALRWWWLVLLLTALGVGGIFAWDSRQIPMYRANTTLLFQSTTVSWMDESAAFRLAEEMTQVYAQVISAQPVMRQVITQLDLETTPTELASRVRAAAIPDTRLLTLSVVDPDPTRAAAIVNAVAKAFVQANQALQQADLDSAVVTVESEMTVLAEQIDSTQNQLEALEASEISQDALARTRLELALSGYRSTYNKLVRDVGILRLRAAYIQEMLLITAPAEVPSAPLRTSRLKLLMMGGGAGGALALAIIVIFELLNDTIKTAQDVETWLGLGTLGVVGQVDIDSDELITVSKPRSPFAEAFRVLRTNVRYFGVDHAQQTLVVTSASASEGKSTIVANLAIVMAQAGLKVILVDADLRRPRLHRVFQLENTEGVTSSLIDGQVNGRLRSVPKILGLSVLPAGDIPPNPSELLGSRQMRDLIESWKERADIVLIDSPPILPVTDAAVLSQIVDGVLLVVDTGQTHRGRARKAVDQLNQVGAHMLGVVLNRVSGAGGLYDENYYYYYAHYGESDSRRKIIPEQLRQMLPRSMHADSSSRSRRKDRDRRERRSRARAPARDTGSASTSGTESWWTYLWRGFTFKASADRLGDAQPEIKGNLQYLRPFIARHWTKAVFGVVLVVLTSLLALPTPLITRYLVDDVILNKELQLLIGSVTALAIIKGSGMLATMLQKFYFARLERRVILDIQRDLLARTLHFPKAFFDQQDTGYLMSRLASDVDGLRWFFSSTIVYVLGNALKLIGGLVFLFYLDWRLALVVAVVVPLLLFFVRYFATKVRLLSRASMEKSANVSRRLQEVISATSLIKSFATESQQVEQVSSEMESAFHVSMAQTAVTAVANLIISGQSDIIKLVVWVVGAYQVVAGNWSLGSLLAFQTYLGYVYGPTRFLGYSHIQLQQAWAALSRISALYDIVPEDVGEGDPVQKLSGDIEFARVSFAYDSASPVLQDVSCHIDSGERVALVGPSGVGKTTLISLLLRFYRPTGGQILFDGRPASDYELSSLRRRIGYVSQDVILLSGTVFENLRYGNVEATEEQVIEAARVAGIHDFVSQLPEGYTSMIGENGVNLSRGQKQRLALARALIKDPDILILDEPTSAVDSLNERSILDALPAAIANKTVFIVTHRLATAQRSDRILLLSETRLVDMGTHESLLDSSAFYRELLESQRVTA